MKKNYSCLILSLAFFTNAFSQVTAIATWMSGDDAPNQRGIYGTKHIPGAANKPGARQGAATWTDASGDLWLFGGNGYANDGTQTSGLLNDLWKYSQTAKQWTWISGDSIINQHGIYTGSAALKPGGRKNAVSWTDGSGNLWIFGGLGYGHTNSAHYLNDLWHYNISKHSWKWIHGDSSLDHLGVYTNYPNVYMNRPGARANGVSWIDAQGNLWLFGGVGYGSLGNIYHYGGVLNDLWKYNPSSGIWTWKGGDTTTSYDFYYRYDNYAQDQPMPPPWGIRGLKGVPNAKNKPAMRTTSVSWADCSGNLWLFGGYGNGSQYLSGDFNDLWKYNISTGQWTWVSGDSTHDQTGIYGIKGIPHMSNKPGVRGSSVSWKDALGNFWLFGGNGKAAGSNGFLNDLWMFNPFTMQWVWVSGDSTLNANGIYGTKGIASALNKPGARWDAVSWGDAAGKLWLFGGIGYLSSGSISVMLNDLWQYTTSTICPVPVGLTATNITTTSAKLSWTTIPGIKSYTLQWKTLVDDTWDSKVVSASNSTNLSGLKPGTLYTSRLRTDCCDGSRSSYSSPDTFTTICRWPNGLATTNITGNSAKLMWDPVPGALNYIVLWKPVDTTLNWNRTQPFSGSSYNLTGLTPGTDYIWRVISICRNAAHNYSATESFKSKCPEPKNLTAGNITDNSALLSWNAIADVVSYTLQWQATDDNDDTWNILPGLTSAFYSLTGLAPGTEYKVQIHTICNTTSRSDFSDPEKFTTICKAPIGSAATNITSTSTVLLWTAIPSVKSYTLQWKRSSANTWKTVMNLSTASHTLTDLTSNTAYTFRVSTKCNKGTSSYGDPVNFSTTSGASMATSSKSKGIVLEEPATINKDINLTVNPNPVIEASALISYRLAENGKITMRVVDFTGRSLQNIIIGYQNAGSYTYTLTNLSKLTTGNYIIVLEQNGKVIARSRFFLKN